MELTPAANTKYLDLKDSMLRYLGAFTYLERPTIIDVKEKFAITDTDYHTVSMLLKTAGYIESDFTKVGITPLGRMFLELSSFRFEYDEEKRKEKLMESVHNSVIKTNKVQIRILWMTIVVSLVTLGVTTWQAIKGHEPLIVYSRESPKVVKPQQTMAAPYLKDSLKK